MAEIRSTKDIIMERLKKIDISEEEKEQIIKKEAQELAKKLIVKYMDRPSIQFILDELESLEPKKKDKTKSALIDECINMLSPHGQKNEDIFKLLDLLLEKDSTPLKKLLSEAEIKLDDEKEKYHAILSERLKKRGIYGSAVIPNVNADPQWKKMVNEIKDQLRSDMNNLISKLK